MLTIHCTGNGLKYCGRWPKYLLWLNSVLISCAIPISPAIAPDDHDAMCLSVTSLFRFETTRITTIEP
ncbi:hypothetical protein BV22DRAFT_261648 [Leucogyrophana mollusca]|uniref:Uncharacterized protein n=1 Tax=Leucogyrophana mollusca TaxID=85980 RepID=A0ACB8BSQ5_9AGAM|nr:hypothetical protein BV22DRAFT_261648 [Leucogyrophana mollusca]